MMNRKQLLDRFDRKENVLSQIGMDQFIMFQKAKLKVEDQEEITQANLNMYKRAAFNNMVLQLRTEDQRKYQSHPVKDPLELKIGPKAFTPTKIKIKNNEIVGQRVNSQGKNVKRTPDILKSVARTNCKFDDYQKTHKIFECQIIEYSD
ncbi:Hypothetical_protein [Hexamita inflata]|uniref:Hypothetical_protein n=1 Tax=Hexamita inflata TaxID=28002 RepID=A0ABP1IKL6_9EUKA